MRVDLGDGLDTLMVQGRRRSSVRAQGDRVRIDEVELDDADILHVETGDGADTLSVDDLSATDTFQVTADLGAGADRATVYGSEDDDQISFGPFGVLAPTYVLFASPSRSTG